jgi:predicted transcriptional regulator
MAKASRSNKKQPAFDPSELKDLIFSPAVGTGVGSHLVGSITEFPSDEEGEQTEGRDMSTVANSNTSTGDLPPATVVISDKPRPAGFVAARVIIQDVHGLLEPEADVRGNLSTVGNTDLATVDNIAPVGGDRQEGATTEDTSHMSTEDGSLSPTVDRSATRQYPALLAKPDDGQRELHERPHPVGPDEGREFVSTEVASYTLGVLTVDPHLSTVQTATPLRRAPQNVVLWITEQGDLVPEGRVKRIRLAQDVINAAEESVYDTLWTAKGLRTDNETSRIVQAGYDYLVKRTRLSKKTIQRIVAKLIDKDFIAIEQPADIYRRTSTVYRVYSYKAVLERHLQKGRSHVAKMGPGFSYVWPMDDPRLVSHNSRVQSRPITTAVFPDMTTVANSDVSAVVSNDGSTRNNQSTDTVVHTNPSTVVREATFLGTDVLDKKTSSSVIWQALTQYGAVDDAIIHRLIRNCKDQAPDCTEEEIVHFIHEKGYLVRARDSRIYSPIGFLLIAVPKCLSGEAFQLYREEQRKRRETEAALEAKRRAELNEWTREQEARLADPSVSEDDKQFIRECLGIS